MNSDEKRRVPMEFAVYEDGELKMIHIHASEIHQSFGSNHIQSQMKFLKFLFVTILILLVIVEWSIGRVPNYQLFMFLAVICAIPESSNERRN